MTWQVIVLTIWLVYWMVGEVIEYLKRDDKDQNQIIGGSLGIIFRYVIVFVLLYTGGSY